MQIDASSLTPCQTGQAPPHARRVVVVGGPLHRRQQPVLPQRMVAASPLRVRRRRRLRPRCNLVDALVARLALLLHLVRLPLFKFLSSLVGVLR